MPWFVLKMEDIMAFNIFDSTGILVYEDGLIIEDMSDDPTITCDKIEI